MAVAEKWKGYKKLPPDAAKRLENLQGFWKDNADILLAYLFGSYAEGKRANDIDIAILFSKLPSYDRIISLKENIYQLTGIQRSDLVDLNRACPVLRFDVVRNNRILHMKDIDILNHFELKVIKEHMDTVYLRKVQMWFLKEKVSKKDHS